MVWVPSPGRDHRQGLGVKQGVACLELCPGLGPSSKTRSAKDLLGDRLCCELLFTPLPNGERALVRWPWGSYAQDGL